MSSPPAAVSNTHDYGTPEIKLGHWLNFNRLRFAQEGFRNIFSSVWMAASERCHSARVYPSHIGSRSLRNEEAVAMPVPGMGQVLPAAVVSKRLRIATDDSHIFR
jgi:hypothetical protein